MAKKNKRKESITIMSGLEKSLSEMEKFNPYQCGNGAWTSEKYKGTRKGRSAQKIRKEMKEYEY